MEIGGITLSGPGFVVVLLLVLTVFFVTLFGGVLVVLR